MIYRHPFPGPGPGLGVRLLGEVTGIFRVAYDISSIPSVTIKWE